MTMEEAMVKVWREALVEGATEARFRAKSNSQDEPRVWLDRCTSQT